MGRMFEIGLETGRVVELEHGGVLIVHLHTRLVGAPVEKTFTDVCSSDRGDLAKNRFECVGQLGARRRR